MATLGLTLGYRPVRIGWCIRDGNVDDFRNALQLTHALWGGRFNPVIPVGRPFDKMLVRAFAVDVLIPASDVPELLQFISMFEELYWPDVVREIFPRGSDSANFVDVQTPIELIRSQRESRREALRQAYLFKLDISDPLHDVLLCMFGGYPDPTVIGTDYNHLFSTALAAETVGAAILGSGIATAITPSDVASWNLEPLNPAVQFDGANGIYLGSAGSFEDLTTFWNLRAAGLNLRFGDRNYEERLGWATNAWLQDHS